MTTNEESKESKTEKKKDNIPFSEIINHLNQVCETKFRSSSKATRQHIQARWNEGFRLEDFIIVIDKKAAQWKKDPKFCEYLRPKTLLGEKFESYLNANTGEAKPIGTHRPSKYESILDREIPEPEYDPTIF